MSTVESENDRPLRIITTLTFQTIRLMDLKVGQRFHMSEADGTDLGWWTAEGVPFSDPTDGRTVIEARPDVEPISMRK